MKPRANPQDSPPQRLLTRTDIVNPHARVPYRERLARAGAVDLRRNQKAVVLPSGYVEIVAIDATKTF